MGRDEESRRSLQTQNDGRTSPEPKSSVDELDNNKSKRRVEDYSDSDSERRNRKRRSGSKSKRRYGDSESESERKNRKSRNSDSESELESELERRKSRKRKSSRRRRGDSSESESESESEGERRKRKKRESSRRRRSDSESESEKRRRRRKRKRREKEERRRKDKGKKKEKKSKGQIGAVTNSWGQFGIVREVDMWTKRPEFTAWLLEVKQVNLESLPNRDEKIMFKEYMEDYNTATFPSRKYYDLDAYHRRKMEKQMKKGFKKVSKTERSVFNDEEQRRLELLQAREKQKEKEVVALKEAMKKDGMALAMKEQVRLKEEMVYLFKIGQVEAATAIQKKLEPDVPM